MLALAFTLVERRTWTLVGALAGSALALSVIHPSYTPYVAMLLGGFLVARLIVVRAFDPLVKRGVLALAGVTVPFVLYLAWLFPVVADYLSTRPTAARRAFDTEHYGNAFDTFGDSFRFAPEAIARRPGRRRRPPGDPARGLRRAPALGAARSRRLALRAHHPARAAAFTLLSDVFSVSQARRLSAFLPLCLRARRGVRARRAGPPGRRSPAFGAGRPRSSSSAVSSRTACRREGPAGLCGSRSSAALSRSPWALSAPARARARPLGPVLAGCAFAVPVAVAGLANIERQADPNAIPAETAAAVRAITSPGDVVFSDATTAYKIAAYAPVYVNAAPTGHVASSAKNRPRRRRIDSERFFLVPLSDAERSELLARYRADWVLVDKELRHPESYLDGLRLVYDGGRYALYAAPSRG